MSSRAVVWQVPRRACVAGATDRVARVTLTLVSMVAFALVLVVALFPHTAFAANTVNSDFTAEGITFRVTTVASDDEYGEVTLYNGKSYEGEELVLDTVKQTVSGTDYYYYVTAVAANAFQNNTTLKSISFKSDLTGGSVRAIGDYAFDGCSSLESVSFPQRVAGIGNYAFRNCTALSSVEFAEKAELYVNTTSSSAAIGASAFEGCTSLRSITIPAITSATRIADVYYSYEDYNPGTNYSSIYAIQGYVYSSGYQGWWHSGGGPVDRTGIADAAFKNCTALRSVIFEAGAYLGAYAYFWQDSAAFEGCESLEAVVFEAEQAYAANPNGAMHNATYSNLFDSLDQEVSLYYAVDYYATTDASVISSDDDRGSARLSRIEVLRGTPVGLLQAGNAEALADYLYADAAAYALKEGDGEVPDPNEVAREAGLDTENTTWVWKLTGTQSQRSGLTESCAAYLVPANELSAGRIVSDAITALQKRCDQNFSRWIVDGVEQDSSFDPDRWYASPTGTVYSFTNNAVDDSDDLWFEVGSGGEADLLSQFSVQAADGTVLADGSWAISYQRYDAETLELLEAESFEEVMSAFDADGGPVLVTIEPGEDSSYEGKLQLWILLRGSSGSVKELFTDSASGSRGTWYAAVPYNENIMLEVGAYADSPYAVMVGGNDLASALVATAFAGIAGAPINVDGSGLANYGFQLATSFYSSSGVIYEGGTAISFTADGDAASFAVKSYQAFQSRDGSTPRNLLGASAEDYPWAEVALLLDQGALEEVAGAAAAYAYALGAPVFYTKEDGSISEETLECLADFDGVILMGYADVFSTDAVEALRTSLGETEVDDGLVSSVLNASLLSRSVADKLMSSGKASTAIVTISDAADPFDVIGALNRSGKFEGITLVCASSADAKATSAYLRELRDEVVTVRLFGRTGGNALTEGFSLSSSLAALWDEQGGYEEPVVSTGDTLELNGLLLTVTGGSGTDDDPYLLSFTDTLWGDQSLAAGSYGIVGVNYLLSDGIGQENEDGDDGEGADATDLGTLGEEIESSGGSQWSEVLTSLWSRASKVSSSEVTGEAESSDDEGEEASSNAGGTEGTGESAGSTSSSGGTTASTTGTTTTSTPASTASSTTTTNQQTVSAPAASTDEDSSEEDASSEDETSATDDGWSVVDIGDVTDSDSEGSTDDASTEDAAAESLSTDDTSVPPYVVGIIVAAVVAAAGGGVWFLLRRRAVDPLDDELRTSEGVET